MSIEYSMIVTTDSYAGNFERELPMWLLGIDNEHSQNKLQEEDFNNWLEANPHHAEAFIDICDGRSYDEYGIQPFGLDPENSKAIEIYLSEYILTDSIYSVPFIQAVKDRVGTNMIFYRRVKDSSKYPIEDIITQEIKILKIEIRTITRTESNETIVSI